MRPHTFHGLIKRFNKWEVMTLDAAKSSAPYLHPRLASVAHSGPEGGGLPEAIRIEFV